MYDDGARTPGRRDQDGGGWVVPGRTPSGDARGEATGAAPREPVPGEADPRTEGRAGTAPASVPDRGGDPPRETSSGEGPDQGGRSAQARAPDQGGGRDQWTGRDQGTDPDQGMAAHQGTGSAPGAVSSPAQAPSADRAPAGAHTPPDDAADGTPARDWWGESDSAFPVAEPVRRLSPRSMVVGPINQLRNLVVPIAVGLFVGGFNPWVIGASAAAVVALLAGGLVTWRTVSYEVGPERLEIRSGLVRRSRRTIPLERVRGVDVTSTLLHRLLGVAVVRIEAAAGAPGGSEDGKLDAVDAAEAERLRRVLLDRRAVLADDAPESGTRGGRDAEGKGPRDAAAVAAGTPAGNAAGGSTADDTVTHFSMRPSWYLYGALSLAYLLTPFALLATLFGVIQQSAGDRAADFVLDWVTTTDRGLLTALSAMAVGVLVLLMPVFAVVSYSFTHWGFSLRERDGSLVAERGLFTRRSVTLEKRRIRGHELLDNPLERTRRAVRLRAIVTGLGDAANRAVLLPIGPRAAVEAVLTRALTPFRGSLTPHPRAALYRRWIRAVGPFVVLAGVGLVVEWTWLVVVASVLALVGVALGLDRYRSLGHGYDGTMLSVRSGSLRRRQATVERSAVIGWTWTQTLLQRRAGLADLQVTVGAGEGGYTAIDASQRRSVAFAAGVTPEIVRPFLVRPPTGGEGPGHTPKG
ncbi:putative membrane protein [Nocardiopsis sp. Huas11]|uniref:PH domain-containing protein n=1 Tax=Nocardiopsis sp. Huas11 TaxID=2183912 RepID=UPI000F23CAE9|nr:PH domain-containing protein [Nocardiopsis sp. Huas11]RKS07862.1 putative membrane protein [Nocardiopsis sp. Huas11]